MNKRISRRQVLKSAVVAPSLPPAQTVAMTKPINTARA
jgi:hypothetical protein